MAQYCVMVKGPCRGKSCDFWARVKIRKASIDEILKGIKESITGCQIDTPMMLKEVIQEYWLQLGIHNLKRLSEEEPELWTKMMQIESIIKEQMQLK